MSAEPPVVSPRDLGSAYAALAAAPPDAPARAIAGGTDLMVALTGELGEPPASLVDLWAIDELRGIALDVDTLSIGALTTYTDIRRSALCRKHLPVLVEAAATIGAAQIQNRGTLGGNIANASPAGDTLPVLLAAEARFVLGSARGEREIGAADFWTGYRQTALAPDELVLRIRVPLRSHREIRFRKVGTRRAQSISKLVVAVAWRTGPNAAAPSTWRDVRIALGSVAATPIRAPRTEAVLEGSVPTPEVADRAAEALAAELSPIDDVRSTAGYRRVVAARVVHRIVRDAGGW
ncbi:MAG: FAD binding domain-containing protein [Candidatus Limnocylindrales bacterium]